MIVGLRRGLHMPGERTLNHLIVWLAILLVVSVVGFGTYYYYDRQGGPTGPSPVDRDIAKWEQAVKDDPSLLGPRLALADLYYGVKRYKESVEQYLAASAIDDKNLVALWGLGRSLLALGDPAGAAANFQKVIDASKDADVRGDLVGAAYYYMGQIAISQNNADVAIESLKAAVSIDRSDADAMELLGAAYVMKGTYDDALDQLAKAVRFVPDFAEAYDQMALAYDGKGMASEARYARGMAMFSRGDLKKAQKELEAATESLPQFTPGWVGLGLVLEKAGRKDGAIKAYDAARALDPNDFNARAGLIRLGVLSADNADVHGSTQTGGVADPHSATPGGGQ